MELPICGPLPDPPDRRDSLLKEKKEMKTVLIGVATYFLFLFLKWGKLSKNKNPNDPSMEKAVYEN